MPATLPTKEVDWRIKVRHLKSARMDDIVKGVFLRALQRSGKLGLACEEAGVLYDTMRSERRDDADFDHAIEHTLIVFKENRVNRLEIAAMNGHKEPIFGPNGEEGERTRFESGLRAMVLKAYAPELYGDKLDIDVNHNVGAVVVPAMLNDQEWEAQFVEQQSKFVALDTTGEAAPVPAQEERLLSE